MPAPLSRFRFVILACLLLIPLTAAATPGNAATLASEVSEKHMHWLDYAVLAGYFVTVMAIGLGFVKSGPANLKDYYRGENSVSSFAAGISLMATRLSAVTFISIPAKAYATNWTYLLLPFSNIAVAYVVTRWIIPFYCRLDLTSIYEYLEKRFNGSVRLLGSFSFLALETARLSVMILVPALVITVVTDLNLYACIVAIGIVTTISTVIGGIKGVIWVNVLEAGLMFVAATICIVVALCGVDQPWAGLQAAADAGKLKLIEPSFDLSQASLVIIALYWVGEIKNYVANQTNAQRFIVTRDVASARRSVWIGATSMVGTIILCMFVGTALYVFYQAHPERLDPAMGKPDELLPWFIIHEIPPGLAGLALATVFSASMSGLNSALNSISAVVVTDIYRRIRPGSDDPTCVRVGKNVIWVAGLMATGVGLIMAQRRIDSLFDQLTEMLGLFGGGLGGIFLLGIFTTRANSRGVLVGYVGSCVVLFLVKNYTSIHLLAYMSVGMLSCFALGYAFSRMFPTKQNDLRGLTVHTQVE